MKSQYAFDTAGTVEWIRDGERFRDAVSPALLQRGLYQAARIRTGKNYQRRVNYEGYYWCAATEAQVWFESLLERSVLMLLDHAADIMAVSSQPMRLTVGEHSHIPDYLAMHADGSQTVIDVKPARRVERARDQFEMTAKVCAAVGWGYRVHTELSEQQRTNLEFLSYFKNPVYAPTGHASALVDAAFRDGLTFGELAVAVPAARLADARAIALHMLWSRTYTFDLGTRLTNQTSLHRPTTFGMEAIDAIRQ
ncbi:TnsA-like heteromeric transposase endonuclease subunit [Microbacterium horticulturae]|uniref:TnsA-like heteromeric transposase endonuclease subunit n=1 Tax=Microbacterium horticulturae TaxID=3028316 RepID=A0ABY8BYV2_9MICO|nr:TnsA-like heteromeric transposase endonuclease subunit [Microbacterium sp. KACC 23027]WEG08642.1 TnsA-like heteromeric transposase endonuclease subunit [Microbacterium sp. KACC 23027]